MHFPSRAGFLALFIFSFTLLHVFAAPVSVTPATSVMGRDNEDAVQLNDHSRSRYQATPSTHRHLKHHKTLTLDDPHRPILLPRKSVGTKIKEGFQKAGQAIKKAAQKVGNFVKTTGAKVAKFGLQVVSTAASVASKVAKFIPGVGKPISQALRVESKVANVASNAIHANLGKKLEKGMKVMNKIQNPVGGVAGAVINNL